MVKKQEEVTEVPVLLSWNQDQTYYRAVRVSEGFIAVQMAQITGRKTKDGKMKAVWTTIDSVVGGSWALPLFLSVVPMVAEAEAARAARARPNRKTRRALNLVRGRK